MTYIHRFSNVLLVIDIFRFPIPYCLVLVSKILEERTHSVTSTKLLISSINEKFYCLQSTITHTQISINISPKTMKGNCVMEIINIFFLNFLILLNSNLLTFI